MEVICKKSCERASGPEGNTTRWETITDLTSRYDFCALEKKLLQSTGGRNV